MIFAEAPRAPASIAHERIRNAYAQATGKAAPSGSQKAGKKRLPKEEDDCPICYENMHKAAETLLTFCEECGNCLHKECFQQCAYQLLDGTGDRELRTLSTGARAAKGGVTCVFCRAEWAVPTAAVKGKGKATTSSEGYVNLANVAGVSPVRDTSTCGSFHIVGLPHAHHLFG